MKKSRIVLFVLMAICLIIGIYNVYKLNTTGNQKLELFISESNTSNDKMYFSSTVINSETNELEQCYSLCKSCHEKGVSETNMKCDSCYSDRNYFLLDGNCVLSMTCPNFFYYKKFFNDTFLDEEKNCLSGKEDCPQSLSFYLKNSFECINSCTFENILDNKCYITNLEAGLNNIFAMIYDKYLDASIEFFEDYFAYVYNDKYNLVIKIKFFEFEGKTETKNITQTETNNKTQKG